MIRRTSRRVAPFTVVRRDEAAEPVYEAECVCGGGAGCGAESGPRRDPEPVEAWMRRHAEDTGHRRYLRIVSDHAVLEPPAGLVALGAPVRAGWGGATGCPAVSGTDPL